MAAKADVTLTAALDEFLEREIIWRQHFPARARPARCDARSQRFRASAARLLSQLGWEYAGDATVHLFVTPNRSLGPVVVFGAAPQQPEEEIGRVVQQAARLRAFLRACRQSPVMPVRCLVVTGTESSPALLLAAAIVEVRLVAAEELARLSAAPAANRKTLSAMITEKPVISAAYA